MSILLESTSIPEHSTMRIGFKFAEDDDQPAAEIASTHDVVRNPVLPEIDPASQPNVEDTIEIEDVTESPVSPARQPKKRKRNRQGATEVKKREILTPISLITRETGVGLKLVNCLLACNELPVDCARNYV